ncbi:MAG: hypothetical protein LCH79_07825 [Proteobacteria bacterium]|nr:hypothetical protein [Pseudomonadota bacterium]
MTATIFGGQARTSRSLKRWRFNACDTKAPWPWVATGGANGSRIDGSGLIVPASAPRINVGQGVVIEGGRQNRAQNGVTPVHPGGAWQTDGVTTLTAAPGALGPSGDPMGFLAAGTGSYCYQNGFAHTAGVPETLRWFARLGDAADPRLVCEVSSGGANFFARTFVDLDAMSINTTVGTAELIDHGGGLAEIIQYGTPATTTASAGYFGMIIAGTPAAGTGHYFGCVDYQVGARSTSLILTPGGPLTRTADSLTCTDLAALDLDGDEWTLIVTAQEPYPDATPGYPMLLRIEGDDGAVVTINKQPDGQIEGQIFDGAINTANKVAAGTPGEFRKYAIGYSRAAGLMRFAASGTAVLDAVAGNLTTLPALGTVRVGSANGFWHINGIVQQVATAPRLLSAAEMLEEVES